MRYFLTLSYLGTRYSGWQVQPNAPSVQESVEYALRTLLRQPIALTGCGRTDAGVHARFYVAHFDGPDALPDSFLRGLNSLLPRDIAVQYCSAMPPEAHARFDAIERSYMYTITLRKDPFLQETAWFYPQGYRLDLARMQEVADLLPQYEAFAPFCKTDSGLDHFKCLLLKAQWEKEAELLRFHITANRFLRGMVRLIVGACVYAGLGKTSTDAVRTALETQQALHNSLSVPAEGLALTDVRYPYPII